MLALYIYQLPQMPSFAQLGVPHFGMSKTLGLSEGLGYYHMHWFTLMGLYFCAMVHLCCDALQDYGELQQESMEVSPLGDDDLEGGARSTATAEDDDDGPISASSVSDTVSTFSYSRHFFKNYGEVMCCFVLIAGAADDAVSVFDLIYLMTAS